jgi:very-short-patch-repair endonuclease
MSTPGENKIPLIPPFPKGEVLASGNRHFSAPPMKKHDDEADVFWNRFLSNQGIRVLHFDNLQVLRDLKSVMTAICLAVVDRVELK